MLYSLRFTHLNSFMWKSSYINILPTFLNMHKTYGKYIIFLVIKFHQHHHHCRYTRASKQIQIIRIKSNKFQYSIAQIYSNIYLSYLICIWILCFNLSACFGALCTLYNYQNAYSEVILCWGNCLKGGWNTNYKIIVDGFGARDKL